MGMDSFVVLLFVIVAVAVVGHAQTRRKMKGGKP